MTRSDILIELEIKWDKKTDHEKREFARTLSRKIDNVYSILIQMEQHEHTPFHPLAKLLRDAVES